MGQTKKQLKTITGLRTKLPKPAPVKKAQMLPREKLEAMIIKGRSAGSKEEFFVSKALDILNWDYSYQHPVGQRSVRGFQRLDFLVYTPGKWTILDVRGRYWHSGGRESELEIERVARKKKWNLVVIWDNEVPDIKTATSLVRSKIGGR